MPAVSDIAICLRRWDYSETSQTVALLCREHGLTRGLAKGAKRPKSRFSGGFDVLTRGQIIFAPRPRTGLALLMEWHLECVHLAPRRDMPANRAAVFMVDLVMHGLDEADPHPVVFDAMATALDAIDAGMCPASALLWFQLQFLADIGYRPQLDVDAQTGRILPNAPTLAFSPRAGGVVVDSGSADRWRVRAETIMLIRRIDQSREPLASEAAVAGRANRLLATWVRELLGQQLPSFSWAFPGPELSRPGKG